MKRAKLRWCEVYKKKLTPTDAAQVNAVIEHLEGMLIDLSQALASPLFALEEDIPNWQSKFPKTIKRVLQTLYPLERELSASIVDPSELDFLLAAFLGGPASSADADIHGAQYRLRDTGIGNWYELRKQFSAMVTTDSIEALKKHYPWISDLNLQKVASYRAMQLD